MNFVTMVTSFSCPTELYGHLRRCWDGDAKRRPTLPELKCGQSDLIHSFIVLQADSLRHSLAPPAIPSSRHRVLHKHSSATIVSLLQRRAPFHQEWSPLPGTLVGIASPSPVHHPPLDRRIVPGGLRQSAAIPTFSSCGCLANQWPSISTFQSVRLPMRSCLTHPTQGHIGSNADESKCIVPHVASFNPRDAGRSQAQRCPASLRR